MHLREAEHGGAECGRLAVGHGTKQVEEGAQGLVDAVAAAPRRGRLHGAVEHLDETEAATCLGGYSGSKYSGSKYSRGQYSGSEYGRSKYDLQP